MTTNTLPATAHSAPATVQKVQYNRLWWVGLLAIALALVANLLVRAIALQFITVAPEFAPISEPSATIFFTAVGVLLATVAFAIVGRFARQPARTYTIVAIIALIISLIPNVMMTLNPSAAPFPGGTLGANITLMIEHVVAAVVAVWVLNRWGVEDVMTDA